MLEHMAEARRRAIIEATEIITDYLFGRHRSLSQLMACIQEQVEERLTHLEREAAIEREREYAADRRESRY
tara:strand:+ start:386 stop:598 length:213 start_codon:yes stop_codon:yes gene_type:complete